MCKCSCACSCGSEEEETATRSVYLISLTESVYTSKMLEGERWYYDETDTSVAFPTKYYEEIGLVDEVFDSSQKVLENSVNEEVVDSPILDILDVVPIAVADLDGARDTNIPTDSSGVYVPPSITVTDLSNAVNYPFEGGSTVIATGTNMDQIVFVRVSSTDCSFTILSDTSLQFITPICVDNNTTTAKSLSFYDINNTIVATFSVTYAPAVDTLEITSIDTSTGSIAGNTTITITGKAFLFIANVTIAGKNAQTYTVANSTTIYAVTSPSSVYTGIPGDIVITTFTKTTAVLSAAFTYIYPGPTIRSITTSTGPISGGTTILIYGAFFKDIASVTLGGISVTSFAVISTSQITCVIPSGTYTGEALDIVVTNTTSISTTLRSAFIYAAPADMFTPFITSLSVVRGDVFGGTDITIRGKNFVGITSVTIGGSAVTLYSITSASQLIIQQTPVGTYTGTAVDIVVTNEYGSFTLYKCFTYVYKSPTLVSSSVASGTLRGGTSLTLTGTNFYLVSSVIVTGVAVSTFTVVSPTTISCTTSAMITNVDTLGDIIVRATFGTATLSRSFTYLTDPKPVITSLSPSTASILGGTTLSILGANFLDVSSITIDTVPVTTFTIINRYQMTCEIPIGVYTGAYSVLTVQNSIGTSVYTDLFKYVYPSPILSSCTPGSGNVAGGNTITLTGLYFTGTTKVLFGNVSASSYTSSSNHTLLTVVTPPMPSVGKYSMTVQTSTGSVTTATTFFEFAATPILSNVSPSVGNSLGGDLVTLTGSDFINVTSIQFGETTITSFSYLSSTSVQFTTPVGTGTKAISVVTPQGTTTTTKTFEYLDSVNITGISPNTGAFDGNTLVTLVGTNFSNATGVTVGTQPASNIIMNANGTSLTFLTPISIDVNDFSVLTSELLITVLSPQGNQTTSVTLSFTYLRSPTISSISSTTGFIDGGNSITLIGTNFSNATSIRVGSVPVTDFQVISRTQLSFTVPPPRSTSSTADTLRQAITIETPQGNVSTTNYPWLLFSYLNPPTITSLTPSTGALLGGNMLTITGTNFENVTQVWIGTNNVVSFTYISSTLLTFVTTYGTGSKNITIQTPQGDVTTPTVMFTYLDVPQLLTITPSVVDLSGGDTIVITGSNFTNMSRILLGGTDITGLVSSLTSQSISFVAPSSTELSLVKFVTIETPQGNVTSSASDPTQYLTYKVSPTISGLSSSTGNTDGGNTVEITGTNFTSDIVSILFGTVPVSQFSITSNTTLSLVTPAIVPAVALSAPVTFVTAYKSYVFGTFVYEYTVNETVNITSTNTQLITATESCVVSKELTGDFIAVSSLLESSDVSTTTVSVVEELTVGDLTATIYNGNGVTAENTSLRTMLISKSLDIPVLASTNVVVSSDVASSDVTVGNSMVVSTLSATKMDLSSLISTDAMVDSLNVSNMIIKTQEANFTNTRTTNAEFLMCRDIKAIDLSSRFGRVKSLQSSLIQFSSGNTFTGDTLRQLMDELVPVGSIQTTISMSIPNRWLVCNGNVVSKTEYAKLYAVIGNTYGETTTGFYLPNFQSVFLRGKPVDGSLGVYTSDSTKAHVHTIQTMRSISNIVQAQSGVSRNACSNVNETCVTSTAGANETAPLHTMIYYLIRC